MKRLLILFIPLLAFALGAMGGDMLHGARAGDKTPAETVFEGSDQPAEEHGGDAGAGGHGDSAGAASLDWFKFPNQFFVPILRNGSTTAVMILSLGIEMPASSRSDIEAQEHRLRDALLGALMIEANTGAFDGNFTAEPAMQRLRANLLAAAQNAAGPKISRILIEDIGRQVQ